MMPNASTLWTISESMDLSLYEEALLLGTFVNCYVGTPNLSQLQG